MIETKEIENGREDVYVDRKFAEATHLPVDEKELARSVPRGIRLWKIELELSFQQNLQKGRSTCVAPSGRAVPFVLSWSLQHRYVNWRRCVQLWAKDSPYAGNAKVLNSDMDDDLMHELGMSESQYRIAMMVFIVGYSVFEAPSNMVMKVLNPPL